MNMLLCLQLRVHETNYLVRALQVIQCAATAAFRYQRHVRYISMKGP